MIAAMLAPLLAGASKVWAKLVIIGAAIGAVGLFLLHIYSKGKQAQRQADENANLKASVQSHVDAAELQQRARDKVQGITDLAAKVPPPDVKKRNDFDTRQ